MALIVVSGVTVLDNPTAFSNPFQFEITFDCLQPGIPGELEWKLIYVGSAENERFDQELDSVLVGPVQVGKNKFVFQAPSPDMSKIPEKDLTEVTVILLTCSYLEQEFIRVGYYVNNHFPEQATPDGPRGELQRNILSDKPRVTRFLINWDGNKETFTAGQGDTELAQEVEGEEEDMLMDEGEGDAEQEEMEETDGSGEEDIEESDPGKSASATQGQQPQYTEQQLQQLRIQQQQMQQQQLVQQQQLQQQQQQLQLTQPQQYQQQQALQLQQQQLRGQMQRLMTGVGGGQ